MKLPVQQFADQYGMTRQAAMKYFARGRWGMPDGSTWRSMKSKGKWYAEREEEAPPDVAKPAPNRPVTPEALKAKKTLEEIKLLQNKNDKMRGDLMQDWTRCMYRAFSGFYGAVAGRIMGMRLDKDLAERLDMVLKEETETIQDRVDEAIKEYEDDNKMRVR